MLLYLKYFPPKSPSYNPGPYFFFYCILQETITVRGNFSFPLLSRKEILAVSAAEPNPLLTSVEVRLPALSLQQFFLLHPSQSTALMSWGKGEWQAKVLITKSHKDDECWGLHQSPICWGLQQSKPQVLLVFWVCKLRLTKTSVISETLILRYQENLQDVLLPIHLSHS